MTPETFAYDIDYSEGSNTYLKVDKNHLLPDDYIEYQLTVAASADSMLPVYHPDIRFICSDRAESCWLVYH